MQKLFNMFTDALDELVEGIPWKIYNTKSHNKLITDNYGQLPVTEMPDLDEAEVVSNKICNGHMKVYVKYEVEGGINNEDFHKEQGID